MIPPCPLDEQTKNVDANVFGVCALRSKKDDVVGPQQVASFNGSSIPGRRGRVVTEEAEGTPSSPVRDPRQVFPGSQVGASLSTCSELLTKFRGFGLRVGIPNGQVELRVFRIRTLSLAS